METWRSRDVNGLEQGKLAAVQERENGWQGYLRTQVAAQSMPFGQVPASPGVRVPTSGVAVIRSDE
jgi:hypothetical protein